MAHNWLSDMLLLTATFLGSRPVWVSGEPSRPYMTVSESKLLSLTCTVPPIKGLGCVNTLDIRFTPQQRSRDASTMADVNTKAPTCKKLDPMALVSGRVDHKVPMNSFLSIVFPFTEANFGTYACNIDFDDCGLISGKFSLNITVNETNFDHIQTIGDNPRYFKASAELAHKVNVTWVRGPVQDFELMTLKNLIIDNDFEGRTETLFKIPALTTPEGKDVMLQCTDLPTASRLCNCSQSFDSMNNTVVLYARCHPYSSNVTYISEVKFSHGLQTVSASIKHNYFVKGLTLRDRSNAGVSASSTTINTSTDHVQSPQTYHDVTMWKWISGVCITLCTVFLAIIILCVCCRWSSMKTNGQSAARGKGKALRCFMKWLIFNKTEYNAEECERGAHGSSKGIAGQQIDESLPQILDRRQDESKAHQQIAEAIVHSREEVGGLDQEQPEDEKTNPSIPLLNSGLFAQTVAQDKDVHTKTDTAPFIL